LISSSLLSCLNCYSLAVLFYVLYAFVQSTKKIEKIGVKMARGP